VAKDPLEKGGNAPGGPEIRSAAHMPGKEYAFCGRKFRNLIAKKDPSLGSRKLPHEKPKNDLEKGRGELTFQSEVD